MKYKAGDKIQIIQEFHGIPIGSIRTLAIHPSSKDKLFIERRLGSGQGYWLSGNESNIKLYIKTILPLP